MRSRCTESRQCAIKTGCKRVNACIPEHVPLCERRPMSERDSIAQALSETRTKHCSKCGRDLPRGEFYIKQRDTSGAIRISHDCKQCMKVRVAARESARKGRSYSQALKCEGCGKLMRRKGGTCRTCNPNLSELAKEKQEWKANGCLEWLTTCKREASKLRKPELDAWDKRCLAAAAGLRLRPKAKPRRAERPQKRISNWLVAARRERKKLLMETISPWEAKMNNARTSLTKRARRAQERCVESSSAKDTAAQRAASL